MNRITAVCIAALLISSCGESDPEPDYPNYPSVPPPLAEPSPAIPPPIPVRSHNYDEKQGDTYFYIAAVSEDDRRRGRAVGDVHAYQYLGRNQDGEHVLAGLNNYGGVDFRARCKPNCKIIDTSYGAKIAYSPQSIIGSAFEDAISGELTIPEWAHQEARSTSETTAAKPTPTPQAEPISGNETQHAPAGTDLGHIQAQNWETFFDGTDLPD